MRLSIWQQFSSSHSTDFQIVGVFGDVYAAKQAADDVEHMLRTVAAYWQDLSVSHQTKQWEAVRRGEITPAEKKLSQQFATAWSKGGLDWVPFDPDEAVTALRYFENMVFLENIGDTYRGSEPFESFLRKQGSTVYGAYETGREDTDRLLLTYTAPDIATVEQLLRDIEITYADEEVQDIAIAGIHAMESRIKHEGLTISYGLVLNDLRALPDLMLYLRARGCTNIQVEFGQE